MSSTRRRDGRLATGPVPVRASALALALVLAVSACSGDSDDEGGGTPGPTGSSASAGAGATSPTRTTVAKVTGKLAKNKRTSLQGNVTDVVDGWFDAAYVGDVADAAASDAFPGFTKGARKQARHDLRLMSNLKLGKKVDTVEATKRRVRLDVLAVKGRPVGVTARFVLGYDTQGAEAGSGAGRVRGSLYLTETKGSWQVFGYDVTRGGTR